MKGRHLKFLLVPDSSAARRVRRVLAERGAVSGVVVGTWQELMERARLAYLLPDSAGDEDSSFKNALEELENSFWAESFAVAPDETAQAVKSALIQVVSATDPAHEIDIAGLDDLSERPRRHLADLIRLARSLDERLPAELATIRSLLRADSDQALHPIAVSHIEGMPRLMQWQARLVDRLNRDAESRGYLREEEFSGILHDVLDGFAGKAGSSLRVLQERLYEVPEDKNAVDTSVQWVGVRDFLQEAEVAAGMVQGMLAASDGLLPSDIGLLIPDSFEYATALEDAFSLGGMALSGLPAESWQRDLGREVVFHFLYCRHKPAPAMALAVCQSSPLMPWSREEGAVLAQAVMDGDYRLRAFSGIGRDGMAMLELLKGGDSTPAFLANALQEFASLLRGNDGFATHLQQARTAVDELGHSLQHADVIDWTALRRIVSPHFITSGESPDFNREGVTVWRESQEPWRPVKRLLVPGFAQGHYPSALPGNPVFSADELESIRNQTGLPVTTASDMQAARRLRFKRQLGAVSESITFLIPRRNAGGEAQAPPESLVFMHQLFAGPGEADERIIELDAADDRTRIRDLALAAPAPVQPPRALLADDMDFARDLLALRTDREGHLKPESPSSLETLMVSRLAWLLRRLEAEPLVWAPESVDALLLGTLAHKVFEDLFRPGSPLPDSNRIPALVEEIMAESIPRLAPFLRTSQWRVERKHFMNGTIKAARAWRDVLDHLDAEILASEAWLKGTWAGIPIHGQTDALLALPGNRLLVVDYKRSKSSSRLARMEKGYDSQASLYRAMLESGGPKDARDIMLRARTRAAARTGIVYYMLNDQVSLSDSILPESGSVPGWKALENNVASHAMALIQRRLEEVRAGQVRLNREGDAGFFEKEAGLTPYALENSPLIDLFTVPGEAEEAQ